MKIPCLLLGIAALLPARAEMDRASLVQLGGSVVQVEVVRAQGGYSLGSGVVVQPGKVITNCHVTHDAAQISVLRGDTRRRARSQLADTEHDLCLLHVAGLESNVARLGSVRDLKPRQPVTALGYTGGIGLQISPGSVVGLHRLDRSAVIQSSNFFNSGASGGGLFDDAGQLVGILTFRLRGGESHYFSAPAEWVRELLDRHDEGSPVAPLPASALAYWQRDAESQPDFLKVALLERQRRWIELEAVTARWSRFDAGDAEAWFTRGIALSQLERWPAARSALERAVALEPDSGSAWYRLGVVCTSMREFDCARDALAKLGRLDAALAEDLKQLIDKAKA